MSSGYVLARANINLRGLPAGMVGWVDPTDETISMYIECDYLTVMPLQGENSARTQVLAESDSEQESLLGAGYPDGASGGPQERLPERTEGV